MVLRISTIIPGRTYQNEKNKELDVYQEIKYIIILWLIILPTYR